MSLPAISTYLDHNATSPLRPRVREALTDLLGREDVANPSSVHGDGRAARALLEDARESVAALIGAAASRVIFCSGATEANNAVLRGTGHHRVLVSAVEHPCVLKARPDADPLPVDRRGVLDLDALDRALAGRPPALVAVMLANNETGVRQPVPEAAALVHAAGGWLHVDAVQGPGRLPHDAADMLDLTALGADSLALSAHKMGGPAGIGALVLAPEREITPLVRGGGQERGYRGGTENLLGAVGFGAAARSVATDSPAEVHRLITLRTTLEDTLCAAVPGAVIHGADAPRLANTICVGLPGVTAERQVMVLDMAGVRVSAGSACSSGTIAPSAVLKAMGLSDTAAREAIRISLGWSTTEADTARFLDAWVPFARRAAA